MSTSTILHAMIFTLVLQQSLSTQNTPGITNDQAELALFATTDKSSENTTVNVTITHVAVNGTSNFNNVEPNLIDDFSPGKNSLEQIFNRVRADMLKYYVFTLNLLSFICCILTIIVLQRGALKSSSTVYIRGSAMSSIFGTLLYIVYTVQYHKTVSQSIAFKNFFSYIVAYGDAFFYISIAANSWIILAFALERLFAIWLPLKSRVFSNESRAKKIVALIFVVAILVNIPRFLRVTVTTRIDPLTNNTLHVWAYTTFGRDPFIRNAVYISFAVIVIIIPLPILAILNLLIIIKLRSVKRKQLRLREGNTKATSGFEDKRQVQMERVLVASLLAFLICYTPMAGTTMTVAFEGPSVFSTFHFGYRLLFLVAPLFYVSCPCLNFVLYVLCSKILRDGVKDLFCVKCVKNEGAIGQQLESSKHTHRTDAENNATVDKNSVP
ncbi:growth hormone secretagogue receptor type 1-like [Liolophura sinensis]|uniref:growth hormone secretagogue receptor type 1-like n=1 Tax=Liolophura sinensis TaxID=3198878 RepID=UPI003158A10A